MLGRYNRKLMGPSVIRKGYRIPFMRKPFLSPTPVFLSQTASQELEEEVKELLLKGAVEKINPEDPGFYSRIFLVPKKIGKLRLIIDLSKLNSFLDIQSFKMETANTSALVPTQNFLFIGMDSSSAMGQRLRHSESCTLVQETRTSISKTFPVFSWKIKCRCSVCCFGQAALRSSSNGSVRSVETSCYTIRTILINTQIKSPFGMVEQQRKVCPRCTTETTPSISDPFHRRQFFWMGCQSETGGTSVSWCLVFGPISATHQYFRDDSHSVSS